MKTKVKVSRRALIQRLNRVLLKDGLLLKKTKGVRAKAEVGEYFVIHGVRNEIKETRVDLEKFARKHDALAPWEELC